MKRIILDYTKLSKEVLILLTKQYPDGYEEEDVIQFKNLSGETIQAVEVRNEETIYLVKIGKKLNATLKNIDENFLTDENFIPFDFDE